MEEQKKCLIVYRDNPLFSRYIPIISEELSRSCKYQTAIHAFEQGTQEQKIKAWNHTNVRTLLEQDLVLPDETFKRANDYRFPPSLKILQGSHGIYSLDNILDKTSTTTILGKEITQDENTWSGTKEAYGRILESLIDQPKKVYIINEKMTDHDPFSLAGGNEKAARILAQWFSEHGIANIKIINTYQELPKEKANKKIWIVTDRHYSGYPDRARPGYTSLDIPFSNFFDDVVRKEKLLRPYSNEEYESNLREVVREKFEENSRTLQNTRNQGQDARQR